MLVLGIDPGSAKTGIAQVNSNGQCKFKTLWAENRIPFRYGTFRNELADFLVELEEDPVALAIEQPEEIPRPGVEEKEVRSIVRLNCICAVIISEVTRLWPNINILPWSPRVWRRQNETKEDVAYRMSVKYGVEFQTDDDSDALGIADYAMMRILNTNQATGSMNI
jgi:Holliday junction resolvasome RuvABC endonuclease subunit